jgi:CheY-like chemotaxis protein
MLQHRQRLGKALLIVEDDDDLRDVMTEMFRSHGYTVYSACDGRDGLRVLRRMGCVPNLILLDLVMPRMDGEAFVTWLRSHSSHLDIPIVAITASRQKAPIAGQPAIECLLKPVARDELLETVARFCGA